MQLAAYLCSKNMQTNCTLCVSSNTMMMQFGEYGPPMKVYCTYSLVATPLPFTSARHLLSHSKSATQHCIQLAAIPGPSPTHLAMWECLLQFLQVLRGQLYCQRTYILLKPPAQTEPHATYVSVHYLTVLAGRTLVSMHVPMHALCRHPCR